MRASAKQIMSIFEPSPDLRNLYDFRNKKADRAVLNALGEHLSGQVLEALRHTESHYKNRSELPTLPSAGSFNEAYRVWMESFLSDQYSTAYDFSHNSGFRVQLLPPISSAQRLADLDDFLTTREVDIQGQSFPDDFRDLSIGWKEALQDYPKKKKPEPTDWQWSFVGEAVRHPHPQDKFRCRQDSSWKRCLGEEVTRNFIEEGDSSRFVRIPFSPGEGFSGLNLAQFADLVEAKVLAIQDGTVPEPEGDQGSMLIRGEGVVPLIGRYWNGSRYVDRADTLSQPDEYAKRAEQSLFGFFHARLEVIDGTIRLNRGSLASHDMSGVHGVWSDAYHSGRYGGESGRRGTDWNTHKRFIVPTVSAIL